MIVAASSGVALANDNSALTSAAQAAMHQAAAQNQQQNNGGNNSSNQNGSEAVRDDSDSTSGESTINQAADTGRKSQNMGMMMNMVAAAGLFAACLAPKPPNMALCAMGALAAAQAAHQGQAANASDTTFDLSEFDPGDYNYDGGTNGDLDPSAVPGTGDVGFNNPNIKEGMDKLTESGYKISPEGVTFPDGSFKPASAFDSPSSMVAAGMSPSDAQAAGDVLAAVNKELENISGATVSSMKVDGGSGGYAGGGGGSADFGDLDSFKLPTLKNPFDKADKKKLLAGKSVMVGGEPIGVKGDNIFDMVHRAYQKKRGKNQFYENAKSPARLPSSLTQKGGL